MSTIYIETWPCSERTGYYDLLQTRCWYPDKIEERLWQEDHADRMIAAMTNLGMACRWLANLNENRATVCIVSDRDGKDKRFNGEHDDLFDAIHDRREYEKNRGKYAIFYGDYIRYLDRIRYELADAYEIQFTQDQTRMDDIRTGAEFEKPVIMPAELTVAKRNKAFTRDTLVSVSLAGEYNTATCNQCSKSIRFESKDNFVPLHESKEGFFKAQNGRVMKRFYSKTIKSNHQQVKEFLDRHCTLHGI